VRSSFDSHPHFEVVGEAEDGRDAIEKAPELRPDLIILDLSMRVLNGIEVAHLLLRSLPNVCLILFTSHELPEVQRLSRAAGFHAVVLKSNASTQLIAQAEAAGGVVLEQDSRGLPIDQVTSETAAEFAAHRRARGAQVSTANSSLRVLRRALKLACEWGVLATAPKIKLLPGERHREFVLSQQEEGIYLASAPEPLASVASVLAETGLRPEECYRLRWESITWANGRNGSLIVTHGKTAAARRVLPMTPRVRMTLQSRWESAGKPNEGWIWSALTRSGHIEPSSLKKQHARALKLSGVRQFVLYSLRHTFLTRLGQSGCDTWTLARIAGHSSITMSARYVHPSEDAVLVAVERLGGHNFGHSQKQLEQDRSSESSYPTDRQDKDWWAVQDSNLRPPACKAGALTN
jgi:integrase